MTNTVRKWAEALMELNKLLSVHYVSYTAEEDKRIKQLRKKINHLKAKIIKEEPIKK